MCCFCVFLITLTPAFVMSWKIWFVFSAIVVVLTTSHWSAYVVASSGNMSELWRRTRRSPISCLVCGYYTALDQQRAAEQSSPEPIVFDYNREVAALEALIAKAARIETSKRRKRARTRLERAAERSRSTIHRIRHIQALQLKLEQERLAVEIERGA